MQIKTFNTTAGVYLRGISLYLDVQIDYTVDTSRRGHPKVDELKAMRVKINGQYQGVEELTLALRDEGCRQELFEEIQEQETDDAEYGEQPEQLDGAQHLGRSRY